MIDRAVSSQRPIATGRRSGVGRRRAAWAAAIGGVVLLVGSACGVPSSGPPVADSTVSGNSGSGVGGSGQLPPGPDSEGIETPIDFTTAYLSAVAGATTQDAQLQQARAFMAPNIADHWAPSEPITVVRQIGELKDTPKQEQSVALPSDVVSGTFQIVGMYNPETGEVDPPSSTKNTTTLRFDTTPVDNRADIGDRSNDLNSGSLQFTQVPSMMVMSESALQTYFTPHPIYFWDSTRQALIADLRYLPTVLSPILQATKVVNWVLNGPSAWISHTASPLVTGTTLVDPTVRVDSRSGAYVINLSSNAQRLNTLNLLAYELRWSLGRLPADPTNAVIPSPVQIEVQGQPRTLSTGTSYRENVPNLAPLRSASTASTYAISNGKVIKIDVDTSAGQTIPVGGNETPHVLNSSKNASVVLAAVNGSATAAALVRVDSHGQESLWIRRPSANGAGDFMQIKGLPPGTMSRPQFVAQPIDAVIVAVNGHLYRIDSRNQVRRIQLPPGVTSVSAFSVAADAHRIAYITDGDLYFSVISNGDSPAMEDNQPIVIAPTLDTATAVSWSSVDQLVVAGKKGATAQLAEMNIDGSIEPRPFIQAYGGTITMVTSYSHEPLLPSYFDELMLQTTSGAYAGRQLNRFAMRITSGGHTTALSAPFFED